MRTTYRLAPRGVVARQLRDVHWPGTVASAPMAETLRALLDAYQPVDEHEANDVQRVRVALAGGDVWSRTAPMHVTASALILHPPSGRVLLRWHPHMQRWMQVGGHFDPGEFDPWAVAQRKRAKRPA